jgi:hypothetical protein
MVPGVPIDPYVARFTAGEASIILGLDGATLATWGKRGFIIPTRREQGAGSAAGKKRNKKNSPKGKSLFSVRDLVMIRVLHLCSQQMSLALSVSAKLGDDVKKTHQPAARAIAAMEAARVSEAVAMHGEWMWAVARAYERGEKFAVYIYAARPHLKWEFDMHVGDLGQRPSFGWEVPHIYVPASDIFIPIYVECKKLLGISSHAGAKDV